jgi:uncharacterized protein involved in response to NO
MTTLIHIDEPHRRQARPAGPAAWALWQLGFRPFYLLASSYAALSVLLWALQYGGWLGTGLLRGPAWHAHEMLFGFTLAVVVGFLFTAGQNWSGQPTPKGRALQALALLWLAGRVLVLTPWALPAALVNVAFPLAAAWGLGRALVAGGNRRNYFFIGLLVVMAGAQAAVHATLAGWLTLPATLGLKAGLDVVLLIMAVMAGRVIPMFTNNGVPGVDAQRHPVVERLAIGSVLALLALDLLTGIAPAQGGVAAVLPVLFMLLPLATVVHAVRLLLWQPWRTAPNPLVWVLHAAYAWIPLHLALRAAAEAGWIGSTAATHALTAGAIGTLTLGMMTRTARGHTGRPLRADRIDVAAYAAVLAGAALRVAVPLLWPAATVPAVLASALLWSTGFALYAVHYGPWLCRMRLDGRPG